MLFATSSQKSCWMFRDEVKISSCRMAANAKYIAYASTRAQPMNVNFRIIQAIISITNLYL